MTRSKLKQPNYSLSRSAILATLSKESREKLERRCAWRRYERGEPIVDYLDASDDVFFIALGNVRVTIYSVATRVYEFSTLAVKNRIHAELLRLATLAPRDGKRARRRTGCREHVKECEMDDQAFDELKCG